jgi:hypothetical protein
VTGDLSLAEARKILEEQLRLKSKKAKEITTPDLAHGVCAKSNEVKSSEVKEISRNTPKNAQQQAKRRSLKAADQ